MTHDYGEIPVAVEKATPPPPAPMTHDYGETGWVSIDSRRVLPASDLELIARACAARDALGRLLGEAPAMLHVMRDAEAGHPRAAAADREGGAAAPWCWDHERTTPECERLGLLCVGEVLDGPSDPTGTAAVGGDRVGAMATADLRLVRHQLRALAQAVEAIDALSAAYPTQSDVPDGEPAGPGEGNCRLCWLDGQRIKPIETDAKGARVYKDLCRRCGRWRHRLGGDPPQWLVNRLNRGDRISPALAERAAAQVAERSPKKGKKSKAKKPKAALGWQRDEAPTPVADGPTRAERLEASRAQRRARLEGATA